MPTKKRPPSPFIKVILVSGICAGIFSIAWMLEGDKKAVETSPHTTAPAQSVSATKMPTGAVDEPVPEAMLTKILSPIKQVRPDLLITDVRFSHVDDIYKAKIQGNPVFFTADGQFFIVGEMYQITSHQLVNLQDEERHNAEVAFAPQRAKMLAAVAKEDMVIFPAEGNAKTYIYVFTDIDCGFCRKLHRQMSEMQAQGIEVRYLGFPRAGINSKSAKKLATTWCADNPREVMTRFKQGQNVDLRTCEPNPIADHYALGKKVGVSGTPAIVLASGQLVPGAVDTQQLISILKEANLYN